MQKVTGLHNATQASSPTTGSRTKRALSVYSGLTLSPAHQQLLRASAITPEIALQRGYATVDEHDEARVRSYGFGPYQLRLPALLIPIHDVHGDIAQYLLRPDEPRLRDGKQIKYEIPARSHPVLDVPSAVQPNLGN